MNVVTVTVRDWPLFAGTRVVSRHPTQAAAEAAALARGVGRYTFRPIYDVTVAAAPVVPPAPPPVPTIPDRWIGWEPPTTRTDGSPLTNLLGIRVYRSTSPDFATAELITDPYVIAAAGGYRDDAAPAGVTLHYWLDALDDQGIASEPVIQIARKYV